MEGVALIKVVAISSRGEDFDVNRSSSCNPSFSYSETLMVVMSLGFESTFVSVEGKERTTVGYRG